MGKELCLTCGDIGFKTELVSCCKCLEAAIHKYCMHVMPNKEESVLWVCEECEKAESLKKARIRAHMVTDSDDEVPVEEWKKNQTANEKISRKNWKKGQTRDSREKLKKDQTGDDGISLEKLKKDQTGDKEISRGKLKKDQTGDKEISSKKLKTNPTDEDGKISTEELKKNHSENEGLKPEKHEVKKESKQLNSSAISAEPLIRSLWTGSFNIRNSNNSIHTRMCEFSAYLSSKARQDIYNEVVRFQPELEILPKSQLLPKHFNGTGLTDDDIGVYFFPSLMKYEQIYDYLVFEMIRDDIAMRASVGNAELLIFTSVELPLRFRRFQGKLYLWGVLSEF